MVCFMFQHHQDGLVNKYIAALVRLSADTDHFRSFDFVVLLSDKFIERKMIETEKGRSFAAKNRPTAADVECAAAQKNAAR